MAISEHLIEGMMPHENKAPSSRDEMLQTLESADEEASIVLIIEGVGYPGGSYSIQRSDELRPGIARATWAGLQEALHSH